MHVTVVLVLVVGKNEKQRSLLAFKETNQNTQEVKMNAV